MTAKPRPETVTVLVSSVGRRSQLIECFRQALSEMGVCGRVLGMDTAPETAPAAYLVDKCFTVRRCGDPGFIDDVLRIAIEDNVSLVVIPLLTSPPRVSSRLCGTAETHRPS